MPPFEELFDCHSDPERLHNLVAGSAAVTLLLKIFARLKAAGDPRETSGQELSDKWEYYGREFRPILLQ